ncbi:MAG: hypothetical protein QOD57_1097 [Actinomycetota bacterium]|nr:hypothetical protein [Actinomycetota bacterium]
MLPAYLASSPVRRPAQVPADRDLPDAVDLLAGAGARSVARFLQERGLDPRRVEPAQVHYRPGRSLAICFRTAGVDRSSGRQACLTVLERRAGEPAAVWAFPDDPALPGLAAATHGGLVRRRLRPRPAEVAVEPLRYRPRRRAVLRYRLPGGRTLFGKVVPPKRAGRLLALAHALGGPGDAGLRLALPVGRIAPGALVLPFLPGASLRDLLMAGGPLPTPDRLAALPEALHRRCLPALAGGAETRPAPAGDRTPTRPGLAGDRTPTRPGLAGDRAPTRRRVDPGTALGAAQVVARLVPGEACAAERLAEALIGRAEASEPPEEWVVHGDLYESQVLVDGETLGLIDLDDLGPGDPLLDGANFSAHLLLLGTSGPAGRPMLRYREELRVAYLRTFDADAAALAWREAYCLLRLVPGPFRVLHPEWPRRMAGRLELAAAALQGL